MRFLLDTNVLITLEDSSQAFSADLADFVRLPSTTPYPSVFKEGSMCSVRVSASFTLRPTS